MYVIYVYNIYIYTYIGRQSRLFAVARVNHENPSLAAALTR